MNTSKAASYICTTRHLKRERNLHPTLLPRMINMKQQEHGTCHETSLFRPFSIHILNFCDSTQRNVNFLSLRTCFIWVMIYHNYIYNNIPLLMGKRYAQVNRPQAPTYQTTCKFFPSSRLLTI